MSRRAILQLRAILSASVFAACAPPPAPAAPAPVAAAPAPAVHAEPPATPDAPFRASPPPAAEMAAWAPPRIETWAMPNGVRVLFVERHDLPIVAVRAVSRVGAGDLPGERAGAAAFLGSMLEQGAGTRSALQVSDDYESLGAEHGAWCDWDVCAARVKVLSSRLAPALDLLADVVLRPALADAEIERARKRWLASLQEDKSSPPSMEQNALAAVLYGREHAYGHSLRGAPGDAAALRRDEIERLWRRAFQPRSTTLVVAGDVTAADLRALLDARFAPWSPPASPRPAATLPPRPLPAGVHVALVDVPGAAQSQVYVAQQGPSYGTGDRIALGVMNTILGGMFSSRINLDLRETKAFTYGAHSRLSMRHGPGPFTAGGSIFTEHTGEAVRALLSQVSLIRSEPVTEQELADAKENAKLALPARFESADGIAAGLQDLAAYDLPLDEYASRAARVDAVTADDVLRVAKKWLHPEAMRVVVTGDRARVERDLAVFGPVELRDAYGDPVK